MGKVDDYEREELMDYYRLLMLTVSVLKKYGTNLISTCNKHGTKNRPENSGLFFASVCQKNFTRKRNAVE